MIDLRLRFPDEQTMLDALTAQGMTTTDEQGAITVLPGSHQYALDVIGTIPPDTGYCVNLRVLDDAMDVTAFAPYVIEPKNIYRVWA